MRIVHVSAHYPPNLVSGGTLVPQRVARELVRRGHEVHVYAGHLDPEREPLETWDEVDEEGVRVRWVVTTPWTAWSDPRNSLNPDVTQDFERWLGEVQPDVVHVHSLQTLGAGLVAAARRSGAAVVVTMHDFWWTCARQFLVAPDMTPCSLVVDCGDCPCAASHDWLEARNARLRPLLDEAHVVLAPSRSAARVMAANGVDARRLRVDENGLPPDELAVDAAAVGDGERAPAASADPADVASGPLRLIFAGGTDPMKGLDVLLEAVRALPGDGSWQLDAYGVQDRPVPRGVRTRPPYGRHELASVLAEHDVLVLPSVMRESHSILTREALAAGLAVVCTDTLGPEEAVRHGVNGLVVPAADPDALGDAIGRLVADRALTARLRQGGLVAPIRSLTDQVDGLEDLYREVVAGLAGPAEVTVTDDATLEAEEALLQRVLVVVGIQGAALRYRAHLPAEALRLHGVRAVVRHYRDPELPELAARADAVVLYRVPATRQVADLVAAVRARPRAVPVVFDIDDLIFDPGLRGQVHGLHVLSEDEEALWWRGVARYRTTMEMCDAYIGSTEALCDHATTVTGLPSFRFPNGAGRDLARLSEEAMRAPREDGPPRIGYFSGTNTHDADWAVIEPAVVRVLAERPEVELWLGGMLTTGPALEPYADRVRRLPMLPWTELPARLRQVDVNLAPLVLDNRFNEAKSAIKWLEAALVGTPTVASPTQPFREAITDGETGVLAATEDEWAEGIGRLLDDALLRRRTGSLARREALLRWGPHTQGAVYLDALRRAAAVRRDVGPRRPTGWEPVLDDEPFDAAEAWVDPYPLPRRTTAGWRSAVVATAPGRKAAAAYRVLRTAGPGAVARKTLQVARRAR
ncbi:glycosyltransferase [Actinotalea sp. AC32]|nr:glycosyltransferase [Actinotalea sp. AC32]